MYCTVSGVHVVLSVVKSKGKPITGIASVKMIQTFDFYVKTEIEKHNNPVIVVIK